MSDKADKSSIDQKRPDRVPSGNNKPKTEQASHQGGGGVRSDHKPQGPGTK